ncbi:MAG: permease [Candidatus Spyradosoma sp.]
MIRDFADRFVHDVLLFPAGTRLGDAVNFFVYDTLKILALLYVVSFLMGVVNAFFPIARVRKFLAERELFGAQYLLAALFGALTPFCSCSSVPLFIGFVRGGIPLGVTFAFLITSPLVNEIAVAMFLGAFGVKATLIYAVSGTLLGAVGGWALGKMRLEKRLTPWARAATAVGGNDAPATADAEPGARAPFLRRVPAIARDAHGIVVGVLPYVLAGIAVGAGVHGFVPAGFFEDVLRGGDAWSVPAAVLVAVPMYANAAAVVPVIQVFVAKGVPLGTAIAFMMATVGLSLPEAILLKRAMTLPLLGVFFGTVAAFIVALGFFFNAVL